ncbi:preprotein translocase subunit YajC [Bombilactobacillus folatiphilus]|uniref:Preprotein translocase subunit YajC n=2 Tax=Bombilactobacillus folatiphilus TaxID=2923362 RepID=A0ABY4PB02_9LACO|nr:preprotein translocase subunit YajC [Bombilactobacillus folatiphilus]UQS82862.1 preprotein translocase subunit YajC [Bombilactobacillus folatiphilus]
MMILVFFVIMIVLMYFTMWRPQKKQQEQRQKMLSELKVGDPIVTIGGLHGVIDTINDEDKTMVLDCDGIYLTFSRSAIRAANPKTVAPVASTKPTTEKSQSDVTSEAKASEVEKDQTSDTETSQSN